MIIPPLNFVRFANYTTSIKLQDMKKETVLKTFSFKMTTTIAKLTP